MEYRIFIRVRQGTSQVGRDGWDGVLHDHDERVDRVRLKRAESERKNVMCMGVTNPTLLNHG